ncbi:MerR family transcriptional regulator [Zoogloea oryzae]|uniref:MerR family transcriptional regulator n=1 Tax=Zoogloea oryzae TaxID=310767 RepID=A0ABQ6FFQ0_9RHOO|nr:MerR family DNA-binding transcriptional regulator [Zoogloea oryzae]GLT24119.1 MerR family transcriptional regulator [Zoogloea oryzae]
MIDETTYTIGDLAREFGITPRAIRFYEDEGLLAPVRAGRNRIYNKRHRTRLGLILRGKRLGLSLAEIGELLGMYDGLRDSAPQLRRLLVVLAERRRALEQQREDIAAVLGEIDILERQCAEQLAENPEGAAAAHAALAARLGEGA